MGTGALANPDRWGAKEPGRGMAAAVGSTMTLCRALRCQRAPWSDRGERDGGAASAQPVAASG
jgi:hypothetical protein